MDKATIQALAKQMIEAVRAHVTAAVDPILGKLKELEARAPIPGPKGDKGDRGEPGPAPDIEPLRAGLQEELARLVDAFPKPKDGAEGLRGARGPGPDPEELKSSIASAVELAVAAIPRPKDGSPGANGKDGAPGKDADLEQIKQLVAAAVAALPTPADGKHGAPGERGPAGESVKGERGEPGKDGKDGSSPSQDSITLMINEAVERAIAKFPRARDGVDGRDAGQIEPLPCIDEEKSYPRGTFANHRGGTVRAVRATDPFRGKTLAEAGWVVWMNGVAEARMESPDGWRTVKFVVSFTQGPDSVHEFKTEAMKYRGVWKAGKHERGDVVTWNGSGWHCERDTTDEPETSDAWKLMVKRGRDGRVAQQPEARKSSTVALR